MQWWESHALLPVQGCRPGVQGRDGVVGCAGNASPRQTNRAGFTTAAAGTWQKTRSGPVCTMQLNVGPKEGTFLRRSGILSWCWYEA